VILPPNLYDLDTSTFEGCTSLSYVEIYDVHSFDANVFSDCTALETVKICGNNIGMVRDNQFGLDVPVKNVIFADGLTRISAEICKDFTNLRQVKLPDSVVEIGESAFFNCQNLETIEFSQNLTTIERFAFGSCSNLSSLTIPDSIKVIDESAFMGCSSLSEVNFGKNVEILRNTTFFSCSSLKKIHLYSNLRSIESSAFYGCENIEIVYEGSAAEWNAITKATDWAAGVGYYQILCSDTTIAPN
jgi:hypothetical protein